jgi:hypothetical protein
LLPLLPPLSFHSFMFHNLGLVLSILLLVSKRICSRFKCSLTEFLFTRTLESLVINHFLCWSFLNQTRPNLALCILTWLLLY